MNNKKTRIAIISVVALLLVLIGVTYAYWLVTKTQTNSNIISSACLDITLDNEANDIRLSSQYPMSDEEGMKLIPYTFTVTNNCNTSIDYQVALESIGDEEDAIKASAIKVALDTRSDLLSNKATTNVTENGAYASHKLGMGTLSASGSEGSSVTHSLRIWIDENAPISEANKIFQSKISVTIGQGIEAPEFPEGTLAYDILANNEEAVELNTAYTEVDANTIAADVAPMLLEVSYWYGTEYRFDSENGYTLSGDLVQATVDECRNGTKTCGKYSLMSDDATLTSTLLYEITDFGTSGIVISTKKIGVTNIFSNTPTAEEAGLYKTVDDLGESYYYRGNVTNNYVQFGAYAANSTVNGTTFTETTPMYWRIVRVNGDGTIRLVYDGTAKVENGVEHTVVFDYSSYNSEYNDPKYVGYTYDNGDGTQVDSSAKTVLDTWYNTHLKTSYGGYIADGIFCNDREVTSIVYTDSIGAPMLPENAEYMNEYYAPYTRLIQNKKPKLTCTRTEDKYTTRTDLGNGLLIHPVGLLTADEMFFAGSRANESGNKRSYLDLEQPYLTLSPAFFAGGYSTSFLSL